MGDFEDTLAHFGVKGMHWGVRKAPRTPTKITVQTRPGGRIKVRGGKNLPATKDAIAAARLRQKSKKNKLSALSNADMEKLIRRMQLEKQVKDLQRTNILQKGTKVVRDLLGAGKVGQEAYSTVKDTIGKWG